MHFHGLHGSLTLGDDVPGVNYTRNPSEDPEEDVDAEVCCRTAFEEDGDRWDEQGDEVEEDIVTRRDLGPVRGGGSANGVALGGWGCSKRISHGWVVG